jgi:hypothetical protein
MRVGEWTFSAVDNQMKTQIMVTKLATNTNKIINISKQLVVHP